MTELRQITPLPDSCKLILVTCEVQNGMHSVAPSEHTLNVAAQRVALQMERLGFE